MLKRWRKLGWSGLILILLLVAGAVLAVNWASRRFAEGESANNAEEAAAQQQDAIRPQIPISLAATDDFIQAENEDLTPGRSARETEQVDEGDAVRATANVANVATAADVAHGYVWIGTTDRNGHPTSPNLLGLRGNFLAATRVGGRGTMARHSVLRASFPVAGEPLPQSIGLIFKATPVRIVERIAVPSGEEVDHWARVAFAPDPAPRVELDFGNDRAAPVSEFSSLIAGLGYRPAAPGRAAATEGHADVLYCSDRDRAAAFRLAAHATRRLRKYPGMETMVVSPRYNPACAGGASGPMVLRIHFQRSTWAWINGRWGISGDCSLPVTITTNARELNSSFGDERQKLTIDSATSSTIVAGRRTYSRSGDVVTVSEGTIGYSLRRCR